MLMTTSQTGNEPCSLQELLAEVQKQHNREEQAAKRQRLQGGGGDAAAGSAAVAAEVQGLLAAAQLGIIGLPFLPLNTRGSGDAAGQAADTRGAGTVPGAALTPPLPGTTAAAQALLYNAQQQAAAAASAAQHSHPTLGHGSGGSHDATDSADDGSGEGHQGSEGGRAVASRHGPAGRRSSEERVNANKEKNRRAQQRFRLRQKEKLAWLESELQRLRALCTAHGIDPSPPAGATVGLGPAAAAAAAAGAAGLPAQQQQQQQQQPPVTAPSTEQMYNELERILEACPAIPSRTAISYLTAFQHAGQETKRCQYASLRKRYEAGKADEIVTCVLLWLAHPAPDRAAAGGQPAS